MKNRTGSSYPPIYSLLILLLLSFSLSAQSELTFQKPPKEILELVDIKLPPVAVVDRKAENIVLLERPTFKSLEEIATDELKLAGIRINPLTFDMSRSYYYTGISIKNVETGKETVVKGLPENVKIKYPSFSPEYNYFTFVIAADNGLELWTVNIKTGEAKKITPAKLTSVMGMPYSWSPDEKFIYCFIHSLSKPLFKDKELPKGPSVQDASGEKAPARTYTDLLKNKNDEDKFDYYAASSISKFSLDGKETPFLPAKVYRSFQPSPDGSYLLVEEVNKPYSYQLPYYRFPYKVSVIDKNGKFVKELISKPLQDKISNAFDAVEEGMRDFSWRGDKPSTIMWTEAQDKGDPDKPADKRDKVYQMDAPFDGQQGRLICSTVNRFSYIVWGDNSTAIVHDSWWKNRNRKMYLINPETLNENPKVIFEGSSEDLYNDPGRFVTAPNKFNENTLLFNNDKSKLYLLGEGASPEGNKPFVDEYDLKSGEKKRLWRADGKSTFESIIKIIDINKNLLLTRIEGPKTYPNYYIRNISSNERPKQITFNQNPYKSFENVTKQKIYYKREDGVDLQATLYLPAGYDKTSGRLPMLMEAYPTEFKDPKAAGQVKESPHRFISLYWASPVYWAAMGYAVLEDAQFPIVGKDKEEPNDTYIEQLVANARAAIRAVDTMQIVDPKRVAVMGHSYGAFMTANLLAHSDLFAAGLARSGAYNRSLTPFGFQAEERTYWQAKETYDKMSPFNYADKIKTPILLIHGDADNNSGTYTMQSERLFQAIKGLGGIARLVLLPYESHGYAAKENILHMLWEMDTWLDKYVKNKKETAMK